MQRRRKRLKAHPVCVHLLTSLTLHQAHNFVLADLITPRNDLFVHGPRILDDSSDPTPGVALITEKRPALAMTVDLWCIKDESVVESSRGDAEPGDLVPVAHVNDSVREMMLPDVLVDQFLLIAQRHDTAGGNDGGEIAGDETLDACLGGSIDEWELGEDTERMNRADECIEAGQYLCEFLYIAGEVANYDRHPTGCKCMYGGFGGRGRLNECGDVL